MKQLLLGILSLFLNVQAYAQYGVIKGNVKTSDGKVLPYVNVSMLGYNNGTSSSETGSFKINNVQTGKNTVKASFVGFKSEEKTVFVKEGEELFINFILLENSSELDEIVITGTLKEISKSESPVAIDIISPKLFQKNPTPSIFESLNMINGVRPQLQCNVCNNGDIHINGMEGPYTMVMIDGMPIVSALGTVYGLMGIPNSIIERVEVQKGPASTLYGSEAVGGIINVITKNPVNAPLASFDIYSTSYQELNADLSIKYRLGENITGIFSGNFFNFNKKYDINNDNFTDVTLQNRIAGFSKIAIKHKSGGKSNLALRYYYENRWGGEMQWNESFRGSDSIYGESIYTNRVELIGDSPLSILGKGAKIQYSINRHIQNSAYATTPFLADQIISFSQITKNIIRGRNDLIAGLAIRHTFYDDNTIITQKIEHAETINSPIITFLPGIFIQNLYTIDEKNSVLLGIRYDYNTNHGQVLSPRANWKWKIKDNNIVRIGFGNGYRVVNLFSEDHAAFSGARIIEIRNNLNPEQSWNTNLNYTLFIPFNKGFINLEANAFYTYFRNKIAADYFSDPNKIIFDNLKGYGINRGIGGFAHCKFTFPLSLSLGGTFTDVFLINPDSAGNKMKSYQVQTPFFTGNFALGYNFNKLKLGVDLTGNVSSPMLLPVLPNDYRGSHSPWFCLLNIQFNKKIGERFQFYTGVKNILNFIPTEDPIMRPFDPFDKSISDVVNNPNNYTFDPGYNYAPYQKARLFVGLRMTF